MITSMSSFRAKASAATRRPGTRRPPIKSKDDERESAKLSRVHLLLLSPPLRSGAALFRVFAALRPE